MTIPDYKAVLDRFDSQLIKQELDTILGDLGSGATDSVPYDTSWLVRLAHLHPASEFDGALDWLRQRQYADGSWGGKYLHYHDRIVCTLSAIIALKTAGTEAQDQKRIEAGERFLWREMGRLHYDAWDTIGFPLLSVALVREAQAVNLDIPENIYYNMSVIENKLNLLSGNLENWRFTSVSFSMEAAFPYVSDETALKQARLTLDNGSVGASPSATMAYLIRTQMQHAPTLDYIKSLVLRQGDGGMASINPIDIFDRTWALYHLRLTNALSPDDPVVRQHLDYLWQEWSPEKGLGFSTYFPIPDLDDTAVAYSLLRWGGYPVDVSVFSAYEGDDYFFCYPGEADQSLSVHVRLLDALNWEREQASVKPWIDKICRFLRRYDLDNRLWFDKWHISPYYLASAAVCLPTGFVDDLVLRRVRWMIKTQHSDGGWGYQGESTLEETAYCLQALLYWDQYGERVEPDVIERAAAFLIHGVGGGLRNEDLPSLYIGKCLYSPLSVVRSAIFGALYSYAAYKGV